MIRPFNYIPFSTQFVIHLFFLCYFEYSILAACIVRKNIKLYPLVYTFSSRAGTSLSRLCCIRRYLPLCIVSCKVSSLLPILQIYFFLLFITELNEENEKHLFNKKL